MCSKYSLPHQDETEVPDWFFRTGINAQICKTLVAHPRLRIIANAFHFLRSAPSPLLLFSLLPSLMEMSLCVGNDMLFPRSSIWKPHFLLLLLFLFPQTSRTKDQEKKSTYSYFFQWGFQCLVRNARCSWGRHLFEKVSFLSWGHLTSSTEGVCCKYIQEIQDGNSLFLQGVAYFQFLATDFMLWGRCSTSCSFYSLTFPAMRIAGVAQHSLQLWLQAAVCGLVLSSAGGGKLPKGAFSNSSGNQEDSPEPAAKVLGGH